MQWDYWECVESLNVYEMDFLIHKVIFMIDRTYCISCAGINCSIYIKV